MGFGIGTTASNIVTNLEILEKNLPKKGASKEFSELVEAARDFKTLSDKYNGIKYDPRTGEITRGEIPPMTTNDLGEMRKAYTRLRDANRKVMLKTKKTSYEENCVEAINSIDSSVTAELPLVSTLSLTADEENAVTFPEIVEIANSEYYETKDALKDIGGTSSTRLLASINGKNKYLSKIRELPKKDSATVLQDAVKMAKHNPEAKEYEEVLDYIAQKYSMKDFSIGLMGGTSIYAVGGTINEAQLKDLAQKTNISEKQMPGLRKVLSKVQQYAGRDNKIYNAYYDLKINPGTMIEEKTIACQRINELFGIEDTQSQRVIINAGGEMAEYIAMDEAKGEDFATANPGDRLFTWSEKITEKNNQYVENTKNIKIKYSTELSNYKGSLNLVVEKKVDAKLTVTEKDYADLAAVSEWKARKDYLENKKKEQPDIYEEPDTITAELKTSLLKQQVLDFLSGNTDRHHGNMLYEFDDGGKMKTIHQIDNDLSGGVIDPDEALGRQNELVKNRSKHIQEEKDLRSQLDKAGANKAEIKKKLDDLKTKIHLEDSNPVLGFLSPKGFGYIPKSMADKVKSMAENDYKDLRNSLTGLRFNQDEIDAYVKRAKYLNKIIEKSEKAYGHLEKVREWAKKNPSVVNIDLPSDDDKTFLLKDIPRIIPDEQIKDLNFFEVMNHPKLQGYGDKEKSGHYFNRLIQGAYKIQNERDEFLKDYAKNHRDDIYRKFKENGYKYGKNPNNVDILNDSQIDEIVKNDKLIFNGSVDQKRAYRILKFLDDKKDGSISDYIEESKKEFTKLDAVRVKPETRVEKEKTEFNKLKRDLEKLAGGSRGTAFKNMKKALEDMAAAYNHPQNKNFDKLYDNLYKTSQKYIKEKIDQRSKRHTDAGRDRLEIARKVLGSTFDAMQREKNQAIDTIKNRAFDLTYEFNTPGINEQLKHTIEKGKEAYDELRKVIYESKKPTQGEEAKDKIKDFMDSEKIAWIALNEVRTNAIDNARKCEKTIAKLKTDYDKANDFAATNFNENIAEGEEKKDFWDRKANQDKYPEMYETVKKYNEAVNKRDEAQKALTKINNAINSGNIDDKITALNNNDTFKAIKNEISDIKSVVSKLQDNQNVILGVLEEAINNPQIVNNQPQAEQNQRQGVRNMENPTDAPVLRDENQKEKDNRKIEIPQVGGNKGGPGLGM